MRKRVRMEEEEEAEEQVGERRRRHRRRRREAMECMDFSDRFRRVTLATREPPPCTLDRGEGTRPHTLSHTQNSPSVRSSNGSERPSDASRMLPLGRLTIRKAHRPAGHCFFSWCFRVFCSVREASEIEKHVQESAGIGNAGGKEAEEEEEEAGRSKIDARSMARGGRRRRKTIRFRTSFSLLPAPFPPRWCISFSSQGRSRVCSPRPWGQKVQKRPPLVQAWREKEEKNRKRCCPASALPFERYHPSPLGPPPPAPPGAATARAAPGPQGTAKWLPAPRRRRPAAPRAREGACCLLLLRRCC